LKTETLFWKSFKNHLSKDYLVDRIESYATPGFPDCLIFHQKTGFFTVELKVVKGNDKVTISPLQISWNLSKSMKAAPVFILAKSLDEGVVKLFSGAKIQELRDKGFKSVPGIYEGRLEDLELWKTVSNSKTPVK
tara:strand:- start:8 stop:412 length:405 start_codon:yes stop_codon:yes gene_type:complete